MDIFVLVISLLVQCSQMDFGLFIISEQLQQSWYFFINASPTYIHTVYSHLLDCENARLPLMHFAVALRIPLRRCLIRRELSSSVKYFVILNSGWT